MSNCQDCGNVNYSDYYSENTYTWCTNCGNYGIAAALKRSLVESNLPPHQVLLAFDIGCNGNGADKIAGYRYHGLHGRVLPFAAGASIANSELKIIASAGDGATLSEGINHLVHSVRNNYNFTFILHNNGNYGLTTGQASQTTPRGVEMNTSPDGVVTESMHVLNFVLGLNPTFVARTFSGNVNQMTAIFKAAIAHQGFAFVEVLQSCPTYNRTHTHEWYMERVYDTISIPNYDNTNLIWAREVAQDLQTKIATGVIYQAHDRLPYIQMLPQRLGVKTSLVAESKFYNVTKLWQELS